MSANESLDWTEHTYVFRFDALEMEPQHPFRTVEDIAVHLEEASSLVSQGLARHGFFPNDVRSASRKELERNPLASKIQINATHALTTSDEAVSKLTERAQSQIRYFLGGSPGTKLPTCS